MRLRIIKINHLKDLKNPAPGRSTGRFIYGVLLLALLIVQIGMTPLMAQSASDQNLEIHKITIGEDIIEPGRKQLIEVLLKNYSERNINTVVKLVITLPNQLIITFGNKAVTAKAKSDTRALFVYPLEGKRTGDYRVAAKVFSSKGDLMLSSVKETSASFFAGDPAQRKKVLITKQAIADAEKEKNEQDERINMLGINFDPPDLLFSQVGFSNNNSILRGETAHVKLVITNDGGDVAENIPYSLFWFYEHRPKKKNKFYEDVIKIIAAGEKKVIHIPLTVPVTELKGKYYVEAVIDPANFVKETNEDNNVLLSGQALNFSDIALEFPDESHSFAEDGRFVFQWRSKEYNQFKIQISTDEFFRDLDQAFEIPKGEKWETTRTVRPLVGELPAMGVSLMENTGVDHLYWRVVAKNSQGDTAESATRKFYISLKPETASP